MSNLNHLQYNTGKLYSGAQTTPLGPPACPLLDATYLFEHRAQLSSLAESSGNGGTGTCLVRAFAAWGPFVFTTSSPLSLTTTVGRRRFFARASRLPARTSTGRSSPPPVHASRLSRADSFLRTTSSTSSGLTLFLPACRANSSRSLPTLFTQSKASSCRQYTNSFENRFPEPLDSSSHILATTQCIVSFIRFSCSSRSRATASSADESPDEVAPPSDIGRSCGGLRPLPAKKREKKKKS